MSDYNPITDFAAKDVLTSGDPEKTILGTDLTAEFAAIAAMSATKEDTADKDQNNGYCGLNSSGKIADARFPATLPAVSGANLTNLDATDLTGDIAAARMATNGVNQGLHTIPVMAAAMQPATTNGAAPASVESSGQAVLYKTLDFDQTTQEFAGFVIPMPKSWNDGTLTFQPLWTAASGTGGVVWALQAVALSNDDAIDTAYGTEQTSTDTLIATGDVHIGPTSAAITVAGSPAADDLVFFRVKRVPADGSDTLSADARLIGIRLFFTVNAATDA